MVYGVEGLIIQPALIAGYIYVYKKQAQYHKQLLKKYQMHMSKIDADEVKGANR